MSEPTPEAIEAGANQLKSQMGDPDMSDVLARKKARMILLATAPYLIREAQSQALEDAARTFGLCEPEGSYSSTPTQVMEWLRDRAAAIRDGEA